MAFFQTVTNSEKPAAGGQKLCVLIASAGDPRTVGNTLESIYACDLPEDCSVEICLVWSGPRERQGSDVPNPTDGRRLSVLWEPRVGKAVALNLALRRCDADVLLFTDDDVIVPRNWIEEMVRPILQGKVAAVQGGVRVAEHLERPWLKGFLRVWVAEVRDERVPPDGLVGANMAIASAALRRVLPFDERLGPGLSGFFEDTVLGWRMAVNGDRIGYLPSVAVIHHFDAGRLRLNAFLRAARKMAMSRALVDADYPGLVPARDRWGGVRSALGLLLALPRQLCRLAICNAPTESFLWHYYRVSYSLYGLLLRYNPRGS